MSDLITWLRAQLDEDERVAREATSGPWRYNPAKVWHLPADLPTRRNGEEFVGAGPLDATVGVAATGPADHPQSMADARYIARHHPARVLAEVEAKRRILDEIEAEHGACLGEGCVPADTDHIVRLLALPYADRPGYLEEWRP